jgi:hypothetical protein
MVHLAVTLSLIPPYVKPSSLALRQRVMIEKKVMASLLRKYNLLQAVGVGVKGLKAMVKDDIHVFLLHSVDYILCFNSL